MEPFVKNLIDIAISTCQLLALFVISIGLIKGLIIFLRNALSFSNSAKMFQESRLQMGYSFSLGLNFLVGGSILRTTITPSWEDIGRLAVIIVIRTVLNYLLLQNIHKPVRRDSSLASENYQKLNDKSFIENVKDKI
ncbi:putative membrane protein [Rivularia sp. PCC 7116]|uniref:DUF1622 domain-containing protein n=1 Tax=Rivularia sp. PCC 7116 TaxID=373994 RepID=UPI00029F3EC9|nr:DUF1622 domain-containing protein [Rivularia sp. PCC 7116]AFY55772.1 putative membrane protein [Rivularia sp. PCC 7116]